MIGQPFHLQCDARIACALGVFRLRASASMAPQYAAPCPTTVSPAIDYGAIGTRGLQQPLDAAMLIAQHDLEEQHLFAVGLEAGAAEMSRALSRSSRAPCSLRPGSLCSIRFPSGGFSNGRGL